MNKIFLLHLFATLILNGVFAQSPEFRFITIDGMDTESVKLLQKSFEDPAVFLSNPLVGFEDPAVFFEKNHLKGFEDPAVFIENGLSSFEDPAVFMDKYSTIEWVVLTLQPSISPKISAGSLTLDGKITSHKIEIGPVVSKEYFDSQSGFPAIVISGKTSTQILMPKFLISDQLMASSFKWISKTGRISKTFSGTFSYQ